MTNHDSENMSMHHQLTGIFLTKSVYFHFLSLAFLQDGEILLAFRVRPLFTLQSNLEESNHASPTIMFCLSVSL